jgi:hypothetical protein
MIFTRHGNHYAGSILESAAPSPHIKDHTGEPARRVRVSNPYGTALAWDGYYYGTPEHKAPYVVVCPD